VVVVEDVLIIMEDGRLHLILVEVVAVAVRAVVLVLVQTAS
jgi:hypothetical protein